VYFILAVAVKQGYVDHDDSSINKCWPLFTQLKYLKRRHPLKKAVYLTSLMVSLILVCSCAHQPPPLPQWRYAREAIHLKLHADTNLNLHEGKPHTLMICIYQLKRKTSFNSLTEEIDGRYKLLECQPFDATVANTKRLIIHPGDNLNLLMDRLEGTRYLAIVAGYYLLQKKRIIRIVDFPVITEQQGFMGNKTTTRVGKLNLTIIFGDQQIKGIEIKDNK
jgi:type VI secretion system VasD/TssJ family lipoprotein